MLAVHDPNEQLNDLVDYGCLDLHVTYPKTIVSSTHCLCYIVSCTQLAKGLN